MNFFQPDNLFWIVEWAMSVKSWIRHWFRMCCHTGAVVLYSVECCVPTTCLHLHINPIGPLFDRSFVYLVWVLGEGALAFHVARCIFKSDKLSRTKYKANACIIFLWVWIWNFCMHQLYSFKWVLFGFWMKFFFSVYAKIKISQWNMFCVLRIDETCKCISHK